MNNTTQSPTNFQYTGSERKAAQPNPPVQSDAYNRFLKEVSQDKKDLFYHKLAGILLNE